MKKFFSILFALMMAVAVNAQNDVTKFLGIPVDGYKPEMKQKLIGKGFEYNSFSDSFKGEFNGKNVEVFIVTNNNKVYRIAVFDANYSTETDIKIRFNTLCGQFERNSKYFGMPNQSLSENEDISYEMAAHNKRYQAAFYQTDENGLPDSNKSVWFMIDEKYGSYRILMFYDNLYNQADGEDL